MPFFAQNMWRDRVYNGTLRQQKTDKFSAKYLNDVLDELAITVPSNPHTSASRIHCVNRIENGLYLGDKYSAKDRRFLKMNEFTHVLNVAEGNDVYQVDTGENYYKHYNIKYMGIPAHDRPSWDISVYFEKAVKFIESALQNHGKVLVHCVVGISRSATMVIAYYMIIRGMNVEEALRFVFQRRRIFPNTGFLDHLVRLNSNLENYKSYRRKSYDKYGIRKLTT